MSDAVQSWLEKAAAGTGVLGCGVRLSDRSFEVKSFHQELPAAKLTQILRDLAEAVYALQQNRIVAERLRWRFENRQVRCVTRPGGVIAALLLNQESADLPETEQLLAGFPTEFS